ncbi:unnamed protein product [Ceratitis capitata]|uniref:(Mediterranean fruit fly) hypothetical protein n=1 Tax=Ceratitis capitata TaxID=7213 RepID=A0A811USE3_CERCA|nr:unnamed protein product [Ceratitis capitata]
MAKCLHLCFSCLSPGHATRDCRRRRKSCPVDGCQRHHNQLLHDDNASRHWSKNEEAPYDSQRPWYSQLKPTHAKSQSRDIRNAVRYQHKLPVHPYEHVTPKVLIGLDHCHLGLSTKPILTNRDVQLKKPSCFHVSTSESQMHNLMENYFTVESFGVRALPPIKSVTPSVTEFSTAEGTPAILPIGVRVIPLS